MSRKGVVRDGVMRLSKAQFEALFEGLDWRRVYKPRTAKPNAPLSDASIACRAMGGVNQGLDYGCVADRFW